MGSSQSSPSVEEAIEVAQVCKYEKTTFKNLISLLQETHSIAQFFASALLFARVPSKLAEYRTFSKASEDAFNKKRDEIVPSLQLIGPELKSYYDVYLYVKGFQAKYESLKDESDRRDELSKAFSATFETMKVLSSDILNTCEKQ